MEKNRGFITVATGDVRYYRIAVNLLKSYKLFTKCELPFAIIADRENEYTKLFDKTIILENPSKSYFDKIELLNNVPYDETIFIESDCLIYGDVNILFDKIKTINGFSAMGRSLPLDTKEHCWFKLEETGKYRNRIVYMQRFHSGIMWFENSPICKEAYNICKDINDNYGLYNIGGNREGIDDKLFAVSSAAVGANMSSDSTADGRMVMCYYPMAVKEKKQPWVNLLKNKQSMLNIKGERIDFLICHWANYNTGKALYKREVRSLNALIKNGKTKFVISNVLYPVQMIFDNVKSFFIKAGYSVIKIKPIKLFLKKILKK